MLTECSWAISITDSALDSSNIPHIYSKFKGKENSGKVCRQPFISSSQDIKCVFLENMVNMNTKPSARHI